jgi:hypothetical protein
MANKKSEIDPKNSHLDELPIGAQGYFRRFKDGISKGKGLAEILEEIKAESDFDPAKRTLLDDAIMFVIRRLPNPGVKSENKKKDQ